MSKHQYRSLRTGLAMVAALCVSTIAGNAVAAGTDAGTTVSNSFTLDYSVGGTGQPQITPPATTDFVVDRIVNVTVTTQGDEDVDPGETGAELVFSVLHSGNDNQRYEFILEQPTSDNFNATLGATPITWYVDDGDGLFQPGGADGAGTTIAQSTSNGSDIAPDTLLWAVVAGDIPGSATDGQSADVILIANTLDPATWIVDGASGTTDAETLPDTDGNLIGTTENVLADVNGAATVYDDGAGTGAHSDTGTYNVVSASLTANKTVAVLATDGVDAATCGAAPSLLPTDTTHYPVPGACVEYVISVVNSGSADATAITLADNLPAEITHVSSVDAVFTGGTVAADETGASTAACTASNLCTVTLTNATLAAGNTGTLTIRGLVE